ncbi:MAG: RDD family protein [Actinocrinis sp.]
MPGAYASWGARLRATVIDLLVAAPGYALGIVVADATGSPGTVDPHSFAVSGGLDNRFLAVGVLVTALIWVLNLLCQGRTGASLRQRAFGLRIVRRRDRRRLGVRLALGHYLGHCLGHLLDLPFLVGVLRPLRAGDGQTYADLVCGTVVLTGRQPGGHAR